MKVGIIGAGFVGSTTAYTLAVKELVQEIVLVDINQVKAEAEALDVLHSTALNSRCRVSYGDYADLKNADIVIVTVDSQKTLDGDRMALLSSNTQILKSIVPQIVKYAPDCIVLIATNPVDVMTKLVVKLSGFPRRRVIGSGTVLDTARFRSILSEKLENISPKSIHAYVMGEHGKSSLVSWSSAFVGATPLDDFLSKMNLSISGEEKQKISEDVLDAGFKIYRGKKATYYGIASSLVEICEAIIKDERKELMVSSLHEDVCEIKNVCLSLPTVVGRQGAISAIEPQLSKEEKELLKHSAEAMSLAAQEAEKI